MAGSVFINNKADAIAAVAAGGRTEMDDAASALLRAVRIRAAAHVKTGNYIRNTGIETVPSIRPSKVGYVQDRLVVADDPASMSIEYGHFVRYKTARRVSWVPGQHIMTGAVGMVR